MRDDVRRVLRRQALPGVLPLAAIAIFALTDFAAVGYLLCLSGVALLWARVHRDSVGSGRFNKQLTVAAALLGAAAGGPAALDAPLTFAAAAILGLLAFEPMLFQAVRSQRLASANLAVERRRVEALRHPRAVHVATLALSTGFVCVAAAGVLTWPLAMVCAVAGSCAAATVVAAWRKRRNVAYQPDCRLRAALDDVAPRFAVYFSGPASAQYQLLMWLPYLDRLGDSYVIILREGRSLRSVAEATSTPVVVAPAIADVEHVLAPTVRAVFYVNNSMKNTHCVRFNELTHVQLMHGDSDKPACRNPVSAMYDRVFVAGQAGVDRYRDHGVHISDDQFRVVGRPQVAEVRVATRAIGEVAEPVVLYAPTWTGDSADVNYCSLPLGEQLVAALLARGVTVLLREHPFTRRNVAAARQLERIENLLDADAARTGRAHHWGETTAQRTLAECFNVADALVCDVSGVASDWLYSEKPFASCDMQGEGENFTASFPLSRASYVLRGDGANLDQMLNDLLGADPLAATRRQLKTHYLGDFPADGYVEAFLREARRCYRPEPQYCENLQFQATTGPVSAGDTVW